jgi:hypothetical protein
LKFYLYVQIFVFVVNKMEAKITLSFDENIISSAKLFAKKHHISLSGSTEFFYKRMTESDSMNLEDLQIFDWVSMVSEGAVAYKRTPSTRKQL